MNKLGYPSFMCWGCSCAQTGYLPSVLQASQCSKADWEGRVSAAAHCAAHQGQIYAHPAALVLS